MEEQEKALNQLEPLLRAVRRRADDVTDEHGFAVVNEMDGYAVKVGDGATIAPWRLPDVRAVEHWLLSISDD